MLRQIKINLPDIIKTQGMMYNGNEYVPYNKIVADYCPDNDPEKIEGIIIINALFEACIDNDDRKAAKKAIFDMLDLMF